MFPNFFKHHSWLVPPKHDPLDDPARPPSNHLMELQLLGFSWDPMWKPSNHQCQQQKEYLRVMRQWIGQQKQSKWIELLQASYNYSQSMSIKVSINMLETEVRSLRYKDALAGKPPYGRSSHDTDKLFDVALAMLALSVEQVWWREVPYVNSKPYGPNSQLQLSVKYLPLAAYLAICIKPTWRDIWLL